MSWLWRAPVLLAGITYFAWRWLGGVPSLHRGHHCRPPKVNGNLWMCVECRTIWRSGRYGTGRWGLNPWKLTWRRI